MAQYKLGKDQTLSLDGAPLEGVRDVDISVDMQEADITSFEHSISSTLPVRESRTVNLIIYHEADWLKIKDNVAQQPPKSLKLAISAWDVGDFVPTSYRVKQPINGVVAWEVTLKSFNYR